MAISPRERFERHVDRTGSCHIWTGGSKRGGYGHFFSGTYRIDRRGRRAGVYVLAHRWIYQFEHGEIPEGMIVRHTCDNPPCVRGDHLVIGTHSDNQRDCFARGRAANRQGPNNWTTKLTEDDVREIRSRVADGQAQRAVARNYGISFQQVNKIVRGKQWAHLR